MIKPDEIKSLLRFWVEKYMPHRFDDVFIDELCFVDRARRADLVHANGKLTAFEIKSYADTMSRWLGQQEDYLSSFDEVWLCCHSKHIEKALSQCNPMVGILLVDDFSTIAVVRKAKNNLNVNSFNLAGFLWREELDDLARKNSIHVKSSHLIKEVRHILSDALPIGVIRNHVLECLKKRYSPC